MSDGRGRTKSGVNYIVSTLGEVDGELLEPTLTQFESLVRDEPIVRDLVSKNSIDFAVAKHDGTIAAFGIGDGSEVMDPTKMMIHLNPDYYSDSSKFMKMVFDQRNSDFIMNFDPKFYKEYYINHEFGHLVQYALSYDKLVDMKDVNLFRSKQLSIAETMKSDIIKLSNMSSIEINNFMSLYAKYDAEEWFAELYAASKSGISNGLTDALKKYITERG
ncbi:MAG: hypothetical protein ACK5G7_06890 [Erysipelotrichaceae bacterium]